MTKTLLLFLSLTLVASTYAALDCNYAKSTRFVTTPSNIWDITETGDWATWPGAHTLGSVAIGTNTGYMAKITMPGSLASMYSTRDAFLERMVIPKLLRNDHSTVKSWLTLTNMSLVARVPAETTTCSNVVDRLENVEHTYMVTNVVGGVTNIEKRTYYSPRHVVTTNVVTKTSWKSPERICVTNDWLVDLRVANAWEIDHDLTGKPENRDFSWCHKIPDYLRKSCKQVFEAASSSAETATNEAPATLVAPFGRMNGKAFWLGPDCVIPTNTTDWATNSEEWPNTDLKTFLLAMGEYENDIFMQVHTNEQGEAVKTRSRYCNAWGKPKWENFRFGDPVAKPYDGDSDPYYILTNNEFRTLEELTEGRVTNKLSTVLRKLSPAIDAEFKSGRMAASNLTAVVESDSKKINFWQYALANSILGTMSSMAYTPPDVPRIRTYPDNKYPALDDNAFLLRRYDVGWLTRTTTGGWKCSEKWNGKGRFVPFFDETENTWHEVILGNADDFTTEWKSNKWTTTFTGSTYRKTAGAYWEDTESSCAYIGNANSVMTLGELISVLPTDTKDFICGADFFRQRVAQGWTVLSEFSIRARWGNTFPDDEHDPEKLPDYNWVLYWEPDPDHGDMCYIPLPDSVPVSCLGETEGSATGEFTQRLRNTDVGIDGVKYTTTTAKNPNNVKPCGWPYLPEGANGRLLSYQWCVISTNYPSGSAWRTQDNTFKHDPETNRPIDSWLYTRVDSRALSREDLVSDGWSATCKSALNELKSEALARCAQSPIEYGDGKLIPWEGWSLSKMSQDYPMPTLTEATQVLAANTNASEFVLRVSPPWGESMKLTEGSFGILLNISYDEDSGKYTLKWSVDEYHEASDPIPLQITRHGAMGKKPRHSPSIRYGSTDTPVVDFGFQSMKSNK